MDKRQGCARPPVNPTEGTCVTSQESLHAPLCTRPCHLHHDDVITLCVVLQLHSIVNPDCSRLGLIKTSLMTKETSWHR